MKRVFVFLTILVVAVALLAGCAPSGAPSPTPAPGDSVPATTPAAPSPSLGPDASTPSPTTQPPSPSPSTGTIRVLVTDAPPGYEVTSVVVHFSEVWVHKAVAEQEQEQEQEGGGEHNQVQNELENEIQQGEGGWIQLTITGGTFGLGSFDLAQLRDDGAKLELAAAELVAGRYTQLRVIMNEEEGVTVTYIPDPEDLDENEEPVTKTVTAKLPSGKLRFVRPFEVVADAETEILLDFDLQKSVVFTGASQSEDIKVIVKPVVKLSVSEKGKPAELEATLDTTGEAEAELSTEEKHTGRDSAYFQTTGTVGAGDEARIVIPLPEGTTLGKIESISWWTYLVEGYIPHVDLELDLDADSNSKNDRLVAEAAHQNDNDTTTWDTDYRGEDVGWIQTFEGASGVYTSWANWLTGGPSDVASVNDETAVWIFAANDATYRLNTLANFKAGIGDVDESTVVLAIEIEIDNWVLQSEAYVDDIVIVIDGVSYTVAFD